MSPLKIRDLSDGFGAEVDGFHTRGEVDSATHRQLREPFDDRGVLVFRGLDIDRTAQAYLSELVIRDDAPMLAKPPHWRASRMASGSPTTNPAPPRRSGACCTTKT